MVNKNISSLRGIRGATWGVVGTSGEVYLDGEVVLNMSDYSFIEYNIGDYVSLMVNDGSVTLDRVLDRRVVRVAFTTDGRGTVLCANSVVHTLLGITIYPACKRTVIVNLPESIVAVARERGSLFIPSESIVCALQLRGSVVAVAGQPIVNKVCLLGGEMVHPSSFMSELTDQFFVYDGEHLGSQGLFAPINAVECVKVDGVIRLPGSKVEVVIPDTMDGDRVSVLVPESVTNMGEVTYYPYDMDGREMFTRLQKDKSSYDKDLTAWFQGELRRLADDAETCRDLVDIALDVRETLPPSIQNKDNLISQVIRLAGSLTNVSGKHEVERSVDALPSDIL